MKKDRVHGLYIYLDVCVLQERVPKTAQRRFLTAAPHLDLGPDELKVDARVGDRLCLQLHLHSSAHREKKNKKKRQHAGSMMT